MSKIGDTLKRIRKENEWSQRQLAMKSGVSNTEISRIEDGLRKQPSLTVVRKLATAFGSRENEIMQAFLDENDVHGSPSTRIVRDQQEPYSHLSQSERELLALAKKYPDVLRSLEKMDTVNEDIRKTVVNRINSVSDSLPKKDAATKKNA